MRKAFPFQPFETALRSIVEPITCQIMKQHLSYLLSGLIGGLVVLAGFWMTHSEPTPCAQDSTAVRLVSNVHVPPNLTGATFDFREAAARAMPAVVHIAAKESPHEAERKGEDPWSQFFGDDLFFRNPFLDFRPREGTGSGVIYTSDGYIVTNNHVVEHADILQVTTFDNKRFKARLVGTYPESDLAVLKIDAQNLPTLEFADSDEAQVGQWVLAIGNPLNLTSTVTAGIISARGRDIDIIRDRQGAAIESFIQTDAAVNPGNSGGALVDADGRLLGINTAIATRTGFFQGYSFAIPINVVRNIVDEIIENGSFRRGFLGIEIAEITPEDVEDLGLSVTQGVLVVRLTEGGAAQYAGVLPNDVIVGINGKKVKSPPELLEHLGSTKAGDAVTLKINRQGTLLDIPVVLKPAE